MHKNSSPRHGYGHWTRIRAKVDAFKTLRRDQALYHDLIEAGVNAQLLDNWLNGPRTHKKEGSKSSKEALDIVLSCLLNMGGMVSGGAALRKWLKITESTKDIDIFFGHYPAWVQATLIAWKIPQIDVCLYEKLPWEGFDLSPSKLAFNRNEFKISDECRQAIETNTCSIDFDTIIHPVATLGRACKYADRYGFVLVRSEIEKLIHDWQITDQKTISAAFERC